MAQTIRTEVGIGSPKVYNVDFDLGFLSRDYIYVYQGDDFTDQTIVVTWVNDTQIQCTVGAGEEFFIRRVVPRNAPVNDYEDGAILREKNLDDSFVQPLMLLEEVEDGYSTTDGGLLLNGDLDMAGNAVLNVAVALDNNTAVPLKQVNQIISGLDTGLFIPLHTPVQIADGIQTIFTTPVVVQYTDAAFIVVFDGIHQVPTLDYVCNVDGTITVIDNLLPYVLTKGVVVSITLMGILT